MRVNLSQKLSDIPVDKKSWDALLENSLTNTVFQTYEWFYSWWNTYGHDHELVFITVYDELDQLTAIAPLMITTRRLNRKILKFAGDYNADYCDFIINGNRLKIIDCIFDYLYSSNLVWHRMLLLNIPEKSSTSSCIHTIFNNKNHNIQIKTPVAAPALILNNHENEALNMVNKYSVKRHLKKIKAIGKLEFRNFYKKEDINQHLETFFDQHINRYSLKTNDSLFEKQLNRDFYKTLTENMSTKEWIILSVLYLENRPIAFHFGFDYNNTIIWYKPSFCTEHKQYSPGTILLKHLVEYSVEKSRYELDFTIGDEAFKSRFSNKTRYNQNIAAYRSNIVYWFYSLYKLATGLVNTIIKRFR